MGVERAKKLKQGRYYGLPVSIDDVVAIGIIHAMKPKPMIVGGMIKIREVILATIPAYTAHYISRLRYHVTKQVQCRAKRTSQCNKGPSRGLVFFHKSNMM
jgi:hypothetical protein